MLRTLAARDVEIARKWSSRASGSVRTGWGSLSKRVASTDARKPISSAMQSIGRGTGSVASALDKGTANIQHRLEQSDAAAVGLSLLLVLACVVVTMLVVIAVRH